MALLAILLLTIAPSSTKPADPPKPLPVSAHNCYPSNSESTARLKEALDLGLDNIEIDLGWDESNKRLLVGHDASPKANTIYPTFETYIKPMLDAPVRADGAPTILTIDWKTSDVDAVKAFHMFLLAHPDLFTYAPKSTDSALTRRRFMVCFTGSEDAKKTYDALIPVEGTYQAFSDRVFGANDYFDNPKAYATKSATAYHRFLTFHWGVVERGAPMIAKEWTPAHAARLKAIVEAAHDQGFRTRFYCLNANGAFFYRFPSDAAARLRWQAAVNAGVDWVASDNYAEIAAELTPKRPK
jgi:glycerophosphoryl diester phosphodiesterase